MHRAILRQPIPQTGSVRLPAIPKTKTSISISTNLVQPQVVFKSQFIRTKKERKLGFGPAASQTLDQLIKDPEMCKTYLQMEKLHEYKSDHAVQKYSDIRTRILRARPELFDCIPSKWRKTLNKLEFTGCFTGDQKLHTSHSLAWGNQKREREVDDDDGSEYDMEDDFIDNRDESDLSYSDSNSSSDEASDSNEASDSDDDELARTDPVYAMAKQRLADIRSGKVVPPRRTVAIPKSAPKQHVNKRKGRVTFVDPATPSSCSEEDTDEEQWAQGYPSITDSIKQARNNKRKRIVISDDEEDSEATEEDVVKAVQDADYDDMEVYEVQELLKYNPKKDQYLVHWKGYDADDATWVPSYDVGTPLIEEYWSRYPVHLIKNYKNQSRSMCLCVTNVSKLKYVKEEFNKLLVRFTKKNPGFNTRLEAYKAYHDSLGGTQITHFAGYYLRPTMYVEEIKKSCPCFILPLKIYDTKMMHDILGWIEALDYN